MFQTDPIRLSRVTHRIDHVVTLIAAIDDVMDCSRKLNAKPTCHAPTNR